MNTHGRRAVVPTLSLPSDIEKWGRWRLTFSLDDQVTLGGATVSRGLSLDQCGNLLVDQDEGLICSPVLDPSGTGTTLDVYVASANRTGKGAGRGGGAGGHDDGGCGGH